MRFAKAFLNFWYDFLIGDDWKIAAYTVAALAAVVGLVVTADLDDATIAVIGTALLCGFFMVGVIYDARKTSK